MNKLNPLRSIVAIVTLGISPFFVTAQAADKTWNGAGSDANWTTGGNWGGTAPANADNLIFSGATRADTTNDFASLSLGRVTFNNGGFTLNGNTLTLNGSTTAFFTNLAGVNTIGCPLITTAPGGRYWFVAPNSEIRLTGTLTNTAASGTSVGWLNLTNGGTVRILGTARSTRGMDLFQGTAIVDGGLVDANNDGIRIKPPAGFTAGVVLTNNGTLRVGGGGNVRLGNASTAIGAAAGAGSTSRLDISSGTLELYGSAVSIYVSDNVAGVTAVVNQNGGLVWGSAGVSNTVTFGNATSPSGTYNLNGGTLWIGQIKQVNSGANVFNFNGGTLKPTVSTTSFMQGLDTANVLGGGAIIDTTNLDITIGQGLQGVGGLVKLGTGSLTLAGANTYTGTTVVSNGTLLVSAGTLSSSSSLVVADGARLSITNWGGSLAVSALTLGVTGASTLQLDFPNGNAGAASLVAGTLTGHGTVTINITGKNLTVGQFPLVDYSSASGLASFQLGAVPPGVSATLVKTGTGLQLNITSVVKLLQWSGATDSNWNTSALNWNDQGNGGTPASYSQATGFGDQVTFDGNAQGNVNVTLAVNPVTMTVKGFSAYNFTGAGKITGVGSLTVDDFSTVTLGTVNEYAGGTLLNSGTIYAGAAAALGTGPVTINVNGQLASDGTTARTLTNTFVLTADIGITLGDATKNGQLNLGQLDLNGGITRTLAFNSSISLSRGLTNGAFTTKTGAGSLIITGNAAQSALVDHKEGDLIVDGATYNNGNGWRLACDLPGSTLRLAVTNGGVFGISIPTANLRVGQAGINGDNGAGTVNLLDVAGTVNLTPAGALAGNSAVVLGASGGSDLLNLRTGGNVITRAVIGNAPAITEAHFMGGKLTALGNEAGFITGLTNAFVENGGLTIDTANFAVTVPQALLAAGTGGLTKTGNGTLTLTGANTYTGSTVVNAGKLVLAPAHVASGPITVNANATLALLQSAPPTTVNVASVTIGSGTGSALEVQLSVTNAPAGVITNLVLNGAVAVNVTGPLGAGQVPLFGYGTITGTGSLTLGSVPQGTVGHLVTNTVNQTIDLAIGAIAPTVWTGTVSTNWDTTALNWTSSGQPVTYVQNANVLFDDTASTGNVNLTAAMTPGSLVISNNTLNYAFTGAGSLGGSMTLVKNGTNTVKLSTANSYTGATTINAGRVVLGNGTALGAVTAPVSVHSGATLDLASFAPGLQPVTVGGSGADGNGALVSDTADQNNSLRAVTLTADTVIRADAMFGIRTSAETDPGFIGNGYKLIKTGTNQLNLNGGQAVTNGITVWDSDLGDVEVRQGTLSFQRRMTLGRTTGKVTVNSGATLLLFTLNQFVMPLQTKPVELHNGTLAGTGNFAPEGNTFGGPVTLAAGSNYVQALMGTTFELLGPISGAGDLYQNQSAAGTVLLGGTNTYTGATYIQSGTLALENNASLASTAGIWVSNGATFSVAALGASPWTLGAGQTLGGAGTVTGSVLANGTLAPGNATGTLTVNGNLTLAGNVVITVNKSLAQSNDLTVVSGTLNNTGTGSVVVTNLGPTLAVGDTFTLFNQPLANGGSLSVVGGNATWVNHLAVDGTITVLTVTGVSTTPVALTNSLSGGNLNLTWPTDHTGWRLEVQTNSLASGLGTNWVTWPGSTNVNAVSIPVIATNPAVFFRLVYP